MYRSMTEQRCYLSREQLDQRLANQVEEEQTNPSASVRPIGPRPWSNKPASGAAQLDLAGNESSLPTAQPDPPPGRPGQQLGPPVTVARSFRSKAWGGTVTEPPLPEPPDMTPDDHNRPAYLGPIRAHLCPGPDCPERWLTDEEMEEG